MQSASDPENEVEAEVPVAEEAPQEAPAGKQKVPLTGLTRRATRSIRRARAVYEANEWGESNEGAFLVQEANVLALMDLAEAVRELKGEGRT